MLTMLVLLSALSLTAAPADTAAPAGLHDLELGASFTWCGDLEVLRPVRAIASVDLKNERLFVEYDVFAVVPVLHRPRGRGGWKVGGDVIPLVAAGAWMLGAQALAGGQRTLTTVLAAPAMVVASTVMQPNLRWQPTGALGLTVGWASEWHLFHPEQGLSWRPQVAAVVGAPGTPIKAEVGLNRQLFWSFDGPSRDWGMGWYVGVRLVSLWR